LERYDYIIAGGGCAGLSLAHYLLTNASLKDSKILIIDESEKVENDRTWCFWGSEQLPFSELISKSWPQLSFFDEDGECEGDLGKTAYHMIRSADFYGHIKTSISTASNCHRLIGRITYLNSNEDGACVKVNGQLYTADWIFNSCIHLPTHRQRQQDSHFILQHFKGWWIKTDGPSFNPERATLMDFRTPQYQDTRFFYLLPVSETEALVEYTIFSKQSLHDSDYDKVIKNYVEERLELKDYTIVEEEVGAIPMTDQKIDQKYGERIINIGGLGGAIKPTTGYAFLNIQKQTQQIVEQLENGQSPDSTLSSPGRFRFYDTLLLDILQYRGEMGKPVFRQLFRRNSMKLILRFLAESTNVLAEARLFTTLPILTFLKAVWRVYGQKKPGVPMLKAPGFTIPQSKKAT
jgi:lycopene beta-cyclase